MTRSFSIAAWCGALLVLLAEVRPVLGNWSRLVVSPFGGIDAVLQAGLLEWSRRTAFTSSWPDPPIFFPLTGVLAFMDSLLGQALFVAPLRLFGGVTLAGQYNAAWCGTLVLAGAAMVVLWRACGGRAREAGIAVIALLGAPYTLSELGHLNQLPMPFVILAVAALIAALSHRDPSDSSARWTPWAWWGVAAALVAQAAWGWYGFAHAVIACAAITVLHFVGLWWGRWRAARRPKPSRPSLGLAIRVLLPLAVAGGAVLWLAEPYRDMGRRHPEFERPRAEVRYYSADLKHVLNGGAYRLRTSDLTGQSPVGEERYAGVDRIVMQPGWVAAALALFGLARRRKLDERRRRTGGWLLGAGLVGLVLAFGESIGLPGTTARLSLPLEWLRELAPPFKAFRVAWRFSFLMVIATAWWACAGWQLLAADGAGRGRRAAALVALILLVVESVPYGLQGAPLEFDGTPRAIAALPVGPLLTLPAPRNEYAEDRVEAQWLLWSLETGRPITGGVSGWEAPQTRALRESLFECETGARDPRPLLERLRVEGVVGAVIVRRPGDEARTGYWRARLLESGAVPAGTPGPGNYESFRWD